MCLTCTHRKKQNKKKQNTKALSKVMSFAFLCSVKHIHNIMKICTEISEITKKNFIFFVVSTVTYLSRICTQYHLWAEYWI